MKFSVAARYTIAVCYGVGYTIVVLHIVQLLTLGTPSLIAIR